MYNIIQKFVKLIPIILVGFIAWFSYHLWLQQHPRQIILSNSIEAKDVRVSPKVGGRIKKIYIKEGDYVRRGQIILELEGDEIIAQLNQAKANRDKAYSELADLKKGARSQELAQAKAQTIRSKALHEEAKAKYTNALSDYKRMESLFKDGAISKQTYDNYKTRFEVAEKEVISSEQDYINARENESLVIEGPRKDQVNALASQVEYFNAKITELEKYVNELTVISPINGEVSSFDLKVGELIKSNQQLATITDLSDIYVRVYIPSNKLSKIKLNQKLKVVADAYPGEYFDGHISYIGSQAEFTPRNIQTAEERTNLVYPIKAQIQNKENKLRDGMYVSVKL
ncbi:MAG: hypothetical protein A3B68_03870 [Candidatus Melainabacteria bacterium RIFCSPHIGHO2_02_FULL_34_12]|nr:MAG: hypothetical protein A3B68_03870 [Candidatus Melainabacteria bacterium RIFCSPHIGHO2_02_FULL_34_12]